MRPKAKNLVLDLIPRFALHPRARAKSGRLARVEAQSILRLQEQLDDTCILIYYDNRVSPPTYGDYYCVLMLARMLSLMGFPVVFKVVDCIERRSDWLSLTAKEQDQFVAEQMELARLVLPSSIQVILESAPHFDTAKTVSLGNHVLLGDWINDRKPIYVMAWSLLGELFNLRDRSLPEGFLLQASDFPEMETQAKQIGPYIAWHTRRGLWRESSDTTDANIVRDYVDLVKAFPEYKILLFSTPAGIEHTINVLRSANESTNILAEEGRLIPQLEPGFHKAVPWILGASFYFQRLGGGIDLVPIFSKLPYLVFMNDPFATSHFAHSGRKILPWSREDQRYVISTWRAQSHAIKNFISHDDMYRIG